MAGINTLQGMVLQLVAVAAFMQAIHAPPLSVLTMLGHAVEHLQRSTSSTGSLDWLPSTHYFGDAPMASTQQFRHLANARFSINPTISNLIPVITNLGLYHDAVVMKLSYLGFTPSRGRCDYDQALVLSFADPSSGMSSSTITDLMFFLVTLHQLFGFLPSAVVAMLADLVKGKPSPQGEGELRPRCAFSVPNSAVWRWLLTPTQESHIMSRGIFRHCTPSDLYVANCAVHNIVHQGGQDLQHLFTQLHTLCGTFIALFPSALSAAQQKIITDLQAALRSMRDTWQHIDLVSLHCTRLKAALSPVARAHNRELLFSITRAIAACQDAMKQHTPAVTSFGVVPSMTTPFAGAVLMPVSQPPAAPSILVASAPAAPLRANPQLHVMVPHTEHGDDLITQFLASSPIY